VGKDILCFHVVYLPAILLALNAVPFHPGSDVVPGGGKGALLLLEFTSLAVSVAHDVVTCRHILFSFLFTQLLRRSRNPTSQRRDPTNSNIIE
jgi:hypothetical protein